MPFPNFDFCLICEGIRQELGGKLTILGFFGMTPNVEVAVANPNQPLVLSLVAGFPPVLDARKKAYNHSFLITKSDGTSAVETPPAALNVSPVGRGLVGCGFAIVPPYPYGPYSIRILINGEPKLDTSFNIRKATPSEVGNLPIPPPEAAKPN